MLLLVCSSKFKYLPQITIFASLFFSTTSHLLLNLGRSSVSVSRFPKLLIELIHPRIQLHFHSAPPPGNGRLTYDGKGEWERQRNIPLRNIIRHLLSNSLPVSDEALPLNSTPRGWWYETVSARLLPLYRMTHALTWRAPD